LVVIGGGLFYAPDLWSVAARALRAAMPPTSVMKSRRLMHSSQRLRTATCGQSIAHRDSATEEFDQFSLSVTCSIVSSQLLTTPAPTTAPTTVACEEPDNDEQHNGANGGIDDQRDRPDTKMNAQSRQQPIADERSDNSDDQVSDEPKSTAPNDLTSQPPRNNADDYYDDEAFV
jgi:hypothetical protein